jgi:acetyltransferase
VLHDASLPESALPRLAIRPYPIQYDTPLALLDGSACRVRPIRPEDEPLMIHFHQKLSDQTVYMRYLETLKLDRRIAHERLARVCFIDYRREMALVALTSKDGKEEIIGVARLMKMHGINQAEIAILIRDDFQRRGLGVAFMERLLQVARDEKIARVFACIHPDNLGMQKLATRAGLALDLTSEPGLVIAGKDIPLL